MTIQTPTHKMINGISPSKVFLIKNAHYPTVLDFFLDKFKHIAKPDWQKRFDEGLIFDNNHHKIAANSDYKTYENGHVFYYRAVENEAVVPFDYQVIFENERFMVVDKPHFLPMSPSGNYVNQTLLTRLKQDYNNAHLSPIHRLDKDTAGLVLICKDKKYRGHYQNLFAQKTIGKIYHAIAAFDKTLALPTMLSLYMERGEPFYTMRVNQLRQMQFNSQTYIEIIGIKNNLAKYKLTPITGKLHQLRVHLNHLGIAIKNDPYYPKVIHRSKEDFDNPLQLLAKELRFIDPIDQQSHHFVSNKELIL